MSGKSVKIVILNFFWVLSTLVNADSWDKNQSIILELEQSKSMEFTLQGPHNVSVASYFWKNYETRTYRVLLTGDNQISILDQQNQKQYLFKDEKEIKFISASAQSYLKIGKRVFGGSFIVKLQDSLLTLSMRLNLEQYLMGTIWGEMGKWISEPTAEAIKAQAVVARTYYLYHLKKMGVDYHFPSDESFQVFQFSTDYPTNVSEAVKKTEGEILTYMNQPILALYSSDCGGMPAQISEVWGESSSGYYRAIWDGPGYQNEFCKLDTKHFWHISLSCKEIRQLMITRWNLQSDETIVDLLINSRSASGRVNSLTIKTQRKEYTLNKEDIRFFFAGRKSERGLPSRLFGIYRQYHELKLERIDFLGVGMGHGVGMCQKGALRMSSLGYSYREILEHYYPLAQIIKMKP